MAYYINSEGKLSSTYGLVGDNYEAKEADARRADMANEAQSSAADIADAQNKSAELREKIRAEAELEKERMRQNKSGRPPVDYNMVSANTYKNGGPVIKGEYKHANPTYIKYSHSGDSSLLAKGRR